MFLLLHQITNLKMNSVCFLFQTPPFPSWLSITPPCFPDSGACNRLLFLHFLLWPHLSPWDLCCTSWTEILQIEHFLSHFHSDFSFGWNNFRLNLYTTPASYPPNTPASLHSWESKILLSEYFIFSTPLPCPTPPDVLHSWVCWLKISRLIFHFSI